MFIRSASVQRLATIGRRTFVSSHQCPRHAAASSLVIPSTNNRGFNNSTNDEKRIASRTGNIEIHHRALSSSSTAKTPPSAPPAQQVNSFPSIVIGPNHALSPQGSFAEAQAAFLEPPKEVVESLLDQLIDQKVGVVAHYYMDVELQGVLHAIKRRQMELLHHQQLEEEDGGTGLNGASSSSGGTTRRIPSYPLVTICDSLKMGDDAVEMCSQSNVSSIICLGVDFMSESVSAIMSKNGYGHVPVYRATTKHIGCSLAESAEGDNYRAWLNKSAEGEKKSLHVVYINTSLETKAISSSIIPTITCTSSNVLSTILQASHQMGPKELQICYGPDTYMGDNLVSLLDAVIQSGWSDERIKADLHPSHDRSTIESLRDNINVYPSGNCVVHHMFGQSVVDTVNNDYKDAYVTAHLEVPGEMFQIALRKSLDDEGVVGSTSNILNFIERKVEEAAREVGVGSSQEKRRLQFILGTEAGMVTSIVRSVQDILDSSACQNVEAEIIFPVSSEAVMGVEEGEVGVNNNSTLEVVPGVAGGEGCSTAGGCATCPFMKMNDLDAVHDIVDMISESSANNELQLLKHLPPNRLQGQTINGKNAIELGIEPIVYMREFMREKKLSDELVERVESMAA
mmetsp:Transcript_1851/g.3274  ORF Transcript_1851/g.3274 Transcript_1851/m.3274 type:complete len:626 (+) Transcript_1851:88-1965(+)|eukprot:CAMPEP_0196157406 /NCGR_PEP_ID=MMETSP0910-20130528/43973_1 /TAXON_ID=49265 /ORGANISM="Thalassiosira rotula, Strain GSO102" /LENGTH=625 /DNA_ID=CAMNT_0041422075 /DNA_START=50 /DNA_END=1927 /DNA_ORIENTATION=+